MKIGYPCINNSISRNSPSIFRLASYYEHTLAQSIECNLIGLPSLHFGLPAIKLVFTPALTRVNGVKNVY